MKFNILFLTINTFGYTLGFDEIENKVKDISYINEKLSKAKVRGNNHRRNKSDKCCTDDNECDKDSFCDYESFCGSYADDDYGNYNYNSFGVCTLLGDFGDRCDSDSQCKSERCGFGVCENEFFCEFTGDCDDGFFCDEFLFECFENGSTEDGSPCINDEECASGYCGFGCGSFNGFIDGVCLGQGECCEDFNCFDQGEGDYCDTSEINFVGNGICRSYNEKKEGEPCIDLSPDNACETFCDFDGFCGTPLENYQFCEDDSYCKSGACNRNQICIGTEHCKTTDDCSIQNQVCDTFNEFCTEILKVGDFCDTDEVCEFGLCGDQGDNWDWLCSPGLEDGDPCFEDKECVSGFCDMDTNTCESKDLKDLTCAGEGEKSTECNSKTGSEACCEGLVCHFHQSWRCVKEENKFCAGENTLAKDCGSEWNGAAQTCCDELVCADRFCVAP